MTFVEGMGFVTYDAELHVYAKNEQRARDLTENFDPKMLELQIIEICDAGLINSELIDCTKEQALITFKQEIERGLL